MPATVTKSGPGIRPLAEAIKRLKKADVLVGIPADKAQRKNQKITNASLLFIHSKGSELRKIPARPVLEPSIEANKDLITPHLGAAAQAMMNRNPQRAEVELHRAGTVAANGAKRYVLEGNNLAPNAPSTIARKDSDRPLVDSNQMVRAVTHVVSFDGSAVTGGAPAPDRTPHAEGQEPAMPPSPLKIAAGEVPLAVGEAALAI